MADDRKTDEPFLQRWARRKADATKPAADQAPPETPGVDVRTTESASLPQTGEAQPADKSGETEEIDLSTLPDIDSLDADSDFSVFMQKGIPEALQKRALQKLWRLDPAFGHVDGLLEYGEDFTGNGLVAEAVNTIYKVGKGMRADDDEADSAAPMDADAEDAPDEADTAETDAVAAGDQATGAQAGQHASVDSQTRATVDETCPDEEKSPDRAATQRGPHRDR